MYRNEVSLEKTWKTLFEAYAKEYALEHGIQYRMRWISWFIVDRTIEVRFQTPFTPEQMEHLVALCKRGSTVFLEGSVYVL
jgi:hypothetical protein